MAEELAPSLAENAAAQRNSSPLVGGTVAFQLFVAGLRMLPLGPAAALGQWRCACCHEQGVVPGDYGPGTTLPLPGGAGVAMWQSLLGGPEGTRGAASVRGPSVSWQLEQGPGGRRWLTPRRPPAFPAALWLKCPDGHSPAGRGLRRAWNSPCSGLHVGRGLGVEGRSVCRLRAASACLEVEGHRPRQPAASALWVRRGGRGCLWF